MKTALKIKVALHPDWKKIDDAAIAMKRLSFALVKMDNRSKFEKFYDSVSDFIFGGKSFFTKISNTR